MLILIILKQNKRVFFLLFKMFNNPAVILYISTIFCEILKIAAPVKENQFY